MERTQIRKTACKELSRIDYEKERATRKQCMSIFIAQPICYILLQEIGS